MQTLTQFLGLSTREGLLLTVGRVLDLMDLEIKRRRIRREEE